MAHFKVHFVRSLLVAAACGAVASAAQAQASVTIIGRSLGTAGVAGFGDAPLARSPLQAHIVGTSQLADSGISALSGLTRLDASLGDAYNADGYWSNLSARGFTLDNRFNYRRDGLPINAETAIALDNKERLEVLKGTSGIQAGTSAPGGLLNLVVKRPNGALRSMRVEMRQPGSLLGAVDISQRFGADGAVGLRVNAAYEKLNPATRRTQGQRSLLAVAADWQISADTLLQAELESSHQSQPSVAGYSMLGDTVPDPRRIDLRRNLNDQPWRQPVVMDGDTASLRLQHQLAGTWRLTAHAMQQRLKSDDRTAFPYGVYDANYACAQWCDRFAPDGTFTYWQYVSDHERRTSGALQAAVSGQVHTAFAVHALEAGVLLTRYRGRFRDQVFDIAGPGNIDGSLAAPPSAGYPDANTNRDERSTELFVRDAVRIGADWQVWAGLRHTRMQRQSERTSVDGDNSLRATSYPRNATTPWLAAAWQFTAKTMLYASWGKALETDVSPNRVRYSNAGQSLALASRQLEAGIKHGTEEVEAALTLFDIERTQTSDLGDCSGANTCRRVIDGSQRHRGVEAQWTQQLGAWGLQTSAMWLQAARRGSQLSGINGQRPTNVPETTLRVGTEYRVAQAPGLTLQANMVAEGNRVVLPYNSAVRIGGWARLDLGARWRQALESTTLTWRLGVDNATGRSAWKESPYQFGHVYLYPMAPRTWRASVQGSF
jgi:iron complex outermembrane receptor protein